MATKLMSLCCWPRSKQPSLREIGLSPSAVDGGAVSAVVVVGAAVAAAASAATTAAKLYLPYLVARNLAPPLLARLAALWCRFN